MQSNALQYSAMPYKAVQCLTMQFNALHCCAMPYNAVQCLTLQCNALHCSAMPYNAMSGNGMPYNALQYNALQSIAMQCMVMQCLTKHYNAMPFNAMPYLVWTWNFGTVVTFFLLRLYLSFIFIFVHRYLSSCQQANSYKLFHTLFTFRQNKLERFPPSSII